ncbi:methylated-DNA--protein-cysteine methyltransferase isoform X1 [Bubalus kerabau]|uniref:methylated-DNA--protein-cysteine methyltransferase isoform X1 n=1 Tax=Bubalus carabanensis TaxID=3119969 RepID=UPI00244EE0F2|nr:methylated-DNA--protein-cysteine methyltransferase isoform X1 [Bubalus carabanensis]
MRSTLCKHHLRCPCGCLVAASAGSTSRGEAPACLLLLLRLLCQPAEIKHVCSSCGSSSFLPASLLSPGLPWVQRTESERAVSSVRLPGQPPAYTGTIVLRAELNCTVSVLGRMDKTCEMKYKVVDSPLGKLEISGCEQGLHGIKLHGGKTPDTEPAEAAAPAEQLRDPGAMLEPLLQCAAWLDTYFREPTVLEGLPVPALHHPVFQKESFTRQVLWKLLTLVKFGETVSYQQLAALAGNPRAARAVGGAMRNNPIPILIPCHRVVCSSGAMGNYSGGVGVKKWLLAHEGHPAGKAARGGGSRATGSWRGALGSTASSQPAGRD